MTPRAGLLLCLALVSGGCADDAPAGTLLVTSGFTDQIFVLDARTGTVVDSVSLDRRPGERDEPHAVAASGDGRHWYATVAHGEPSLWKFETAGHRLVGRLDLPLRGAGRVRLNPDGTRAAVSEYWLGERGVPGRVALVDTRTLEVLAVGEPCPAPHDAVFDPSGTRLAVTCSGGTDLVVADAATLEVRARHALDDAMGAHPMNAVWSADGTVVYVSLMGRDAVARVEVETGAVRRFETGAQPAQLTLLGDQLVVAERGARSAQVLDPATQTGQLVSSPGDHPHGVARDAGHRAAYVTWEGAIDTSGGVWALDPDGQILWSTAVGYYTLGVAYSPTSPRPAAPASPSPSAPSASSSSSSSSDAELMQ